MNVEFLVDGRYVIPVRAIPYVTGWSMSPDLVVSWLAHTETFNRIPRVLAHHLLTDGKSAPLLPKEWDGVNADLEILSAKLHALETIEQESYPTWRRESIPLLPAGVFVWKDEFESAFARGYSRHRMTFLAERDGDRELNFWPFIPTELREIVVEGFPRQLEHEQTVSIPAAGGHWPWGDYHTQLLGHLEAAAQRFWVEYDPADFTTANTNATVSGWLQSERKVSKMMADAIASILRADGLPTGPRR